MSQVLALLVAIPMALVAALRPNRAFDRAATTSTFAMLSLPTFVAGPLWCWCSPSRFKWAPATGFNRLSQGLGPNLKSVILPSVALAIGSVTVYYRLLRADLIATLQEDYVTMARSKGLSTRYILLRHVMRPSSFSLLAAAGISIGTLFTGAFVVEVLFQLPGDRASSSSTRIYASDYLVVQGMALVAAVAFVVVNFGSTSSSPSSTPGCAVPDGPSTVTEPSSPLATGIAGPVVGRGGVAARLPASRPASPGRAVWASSSGSAPAGSSS